MNISQETIARYREQILSARCDLIPSIWVEENIQFDEPEIRGRFTFSGREYLRACVDDVISDGTDFVYVFGTGVGKTITFIAQSIFEMVTNPSRCLWVFPASDGPGGSSSFVKTRLEPCLRATPWTRERMPIGANRHDVSGSSVRMCGTVLDFVGSNSPSQVAANRCSRVRQDEVEKFFTGSDKEPAASYNADRRTDGVEGSKRFKASSPTLDTGLIWVEFQKTDQQRRFLPCPHCQKLVVLAWNKQFTCFKLRGDEAFVTWDESSRRPDKTWDYDLVSKSAHFVCPHCHGKITDAHKAEMDKRGQWLPTAQGFPKHLGRHLPSMYSSSSECRVGALAVEFLKSEFTDTGIKGFINSRLAEVDIKQQYSNKNEILIRTDEPAKGSQIWIPYLSVDHQSNWPYFWYVARRWLISVIQKPRTEAQQVEFNSALTDSKKELVRKVNASENGIIRELQRADDWPLLLEWLIGKEITGLKLEKWFREHHKADLNSALDELFTGCNLKLAKQGDSEAVEIGWCDTWTELDEVQQRHSIRNADVIIDARFGSMDSSEVFAECFQRCPRSGMSYYNPALKRHFQTAMAGCKPFAFMGWTPILGFPAAKRWKNKAGIALPYQLAIDDPYKGKSEANQFFQYVFHFDAQWALSELARIRKRNEWTLASVIKFTPSSQDMGGGTMTLDEYNRHMRGKYFDKETGLWESTGSGGAGSRRHPDHLFDCEKNLVAYATYQGVFKYSREKT